MFGFLSFFARFFYGAKLYGYVRCKKLKRPVRLFLTRRMIPRWASGQTLGHDVFILEKYFSSGILAHELKHVEQVERDGEFRFIARYVFEALRNGYKGISYEREAYDEPYDLGECTIEKV